MELAVKDEYQFRLWRHFSEDYEYVLLLLAAWSDPEESRDETDLTAALVSGSFRNFMLIWRPRRHRMPRRRSNRWSTPPWISAVFESKMWLDLNHRRFDCIKLWTYSNLRALVESTTSVTPLHWEKIERLAYFTQGIGKLPAQMDICIRKQPWGRHGGPVWHASIGMLNKAASKQSFLELHCS